MTSFGAPQLRSEEDLWKSSLRNVLSRAHFTPDTPEYRTEVEIDELEKYKQDQEEVTFGTKLWNAATAETVTGRAITRAMMPSFEPTGYYPSDEDVKKYASDLPEEVIKRLRDGEELMGLAVSDGVKSFEEFIYNVRDARETLRKRRQLFSGGAGGFAEGFALAMGFAGVEATLATVGATALTGGFGTATAATEGTAAVASTAARASRLKSSLKAARLAAVVDVPLEFARYELDKTLSTNHLIISWAAAVGFSGALGAAFPKLYLSPLQRAAMDAQLEEAAVQAAKRGDTAAAAALRARKNNTKVTARSVLGARDPIERVANMSDKVVREEALKRGIRITTKKVSKQVLRKRGRSNRKMSQVREDLIKVLRKEADELSDRAVQAVNRQVDNVWSRLGQKASAAKAALRRQNYAKALGVAGSVLARGGADLKNAVKKAAQQAAKRGFVVSGAIGKPKGVKLGFTAKVGKDKYKLAGNLERMLWKIATDKGKKAASNKRTLVDYLKREGIENPEQLASEFVDAVKKQIDDRAARVAQEVPGLVGPPLRPGEYVADISRMQLKAATRRLPDGTLLRPGAGEPFTGATKPVNFRVEADLFEPGGLARDTARKAAREADDEVVILAENGQKVAAGDSDNFVGFDADLGADATVPLRGRNVPEDPTRTGARRAVARGVEKVFDIFTLGFFNPIIYRWMASKSPLVRKVAAVFMDNPQGGGPSSVMAVAQANFHRAIGRLQHALGDAGRAAAKEGRILTDKELIRLVRSGVKESDLGKAEATAVAGIRQFYKELREYGAANGLPMENIPDAADYFVRQWSPHKYRTVLNKLGGGEEGRNKLVTFLGKAIRSKVSAEGRKALTEKQAEKIARRIHDYLENPSAKRSLNESMTTVNGLKQQLVKDLADVEEGALAQIGGVEGLAEDLINLIARDHASEMNLSFGRKRIFLDELFEDTIDGVPVHIDDLMDMDIKNLTRSYAQKVTGAVAVRKGMQASFGKETMSLADAMAVLKRAARDAGDSERSADAYVKSFDQIYKTLLGVPLYKPWAMKIAATNNALAQSTLGMTLGFAAVPEVANVFYRTSFKAALQQFPGIKETVSNFGLMFRKNPRMRSDAHEFSSCLEAFTGVGGDVARGDHFVRRMDDIGFDRDVAGNLAGRFLDAGRRLSMMNPLGVMPMDMFLRRWAARASFQHILNTAFKVGKDGTVTLSAGFWKNSRERFAQMGLKSDDIVRLSKVLKNTDNVRFKKGLFGRYKVLDFDFDGVKDQAILDKFVMAIRRNSDSLVQRQSYGEMPWWFHSEMGKMLGQFRTFVTVAKSKQVIAGLSRGDVTEVGNVIAASALAMYAYIAQTWWRSLGQEDPERYFNEKTEPRNLAVNAYSRSGYSTVMPMLIDGVASWLGHEGLIDPSTRTTGQALDPLEGSTVYHNYELAKDIGMDIGKLFSGRELDQQDWKSIQTAVWLGKMPIVNEVINKFFIPMAPEPNK